MEAKLKILVLPMCFPIFIGLTMGLFHNSYPNYSAYFITLLLLITQILFSIYLWPKAAKMTGILVAASVYLAEAILSSWLVLGAYMSFVTDFP